MIIIGTWLDGTHAALLYLMEHVVVIVMIVLEVWFATKLKIVYSFLE